MNLKDKKNPALRSSVIDGTIPAEKFITLTAEEMASEELKAERTALQMQNLFNAKGAEAQEAETDAFECGKCKQRKCRYYQKQTRSADEPMTTFVTCTNCNNKVSRDGLPRMSIWVLMPSFVLPLFPRSFSGNSVEQEHYY